MAASTPTSFKTVAVALAGAAHGPEVVEDGRLHPYEPLAFARQPSARIRDHAAEAYVARRRERDVILPTIESWSAILASSAPRTICIAGRGR